jgi:2-oxo-4-hydroxy-4-carboxy-5-ureidoimidazoline decarboxylase
VRVIDPNTLTDAVFVQRYQSVFEHSPWVVERAARRRPFVDIHAGLLGVVADATELEKLALIRAHPELAGKAAVARALTAESASEQASAGLDRMTQTEFDQFHSLNRAYAERFGFPFIICVRLTDKAGILAAMERRLTNERDQEIETALVEIGEIVRLRLEELP